MTSDANNVLLIYASAGHEGTGRDSWHKQRQRGNTELYSPEVNEYIIGMKKQKKLKKEEEENEEKKEKEKREKE